MTVSNELIDSLLADYKKPKDLIGEHGLLKQLTRKLVFTTSHGNYDTRYEPCWQYDMISVFGKLSP